MTQDDAVVDEGRRCDGIACPTARNGRVCQRHVDLTLADLRALPALYARLAVDQDGPGAGGRGPRVSGSRAAPIPGSLAALSLRARGSPRAVSRYALEVAAVRAGRNPHTEHLVDQHGPHPILTVVMTWHLEVRAHLGLPPLARGRGDVEQQIGAHVQSLTAQWDRLTDADADALPGEEDLVAEIRGAAHAARILLGDYDADPEAMAAPCPGCDELTLVRAPGEDDVVCAGQDCRRVLRAAEYDRLARRWVALRYTTQTGS